MQIQMLDILLVEDDENDVFFVKRAIGKSSHVKSFHVLHDGAEAIKFFRCEGQYANEKKWPRPNVILLDLKMPKMNGFDVLEWLQRNPQCKVIPTIVYSSSRLESDVRKAYNLGANAYFVKPGDASDLVEILQYASEFWSRCEIPAIESCK